MIAFNWVVLLINVGVGLSILYYVASHKILNVLGFPFKIGLWVGAVGLIGQAYRNAMFLFLGVSPSDNEVPLWVMKDIGLWIISMSFLFISCKKKGKLTKPILAEKRNAFTRCCGERKNAGNKTTV